MNEDEKRSDIIAEYCLDETAYRDCQRYQRMSQGAKVPATLMPDGTDLRDGTKKD